METKHTPGPWRLDPPSESHVFGDGYHVISAGDGVEHGRYRGFWVAAFISDADARLIAAAPELFRELEDLIGLAASAMYAANRDGSEYDIDAELASARAAIARALGK